MKRRTNKPKPTKRYLSQHATLYSGTNNKNNMKNEKAPFPTEENQPQTQTTPTPQQEERNPFTDTAEQTRYYIDARYKDGGFAVYDAKTKTKYTEIKKRLSGQIVGAGFHLWNPTTEKQRTSGARPYVGLKLTLFNAGEYAKIDFKLFHIIEDGGALIPELTYSGLTAFNALHNLCEAEGKQISIKIDTKTTKSSWTIGIVKAFIDNEYQSMTTVNTDDDGNKSTVNKYTGEAYTAGIKKKEREAREREIFNDLCIYYELDHFTLDTDGVPLKPLPADTKKWYKAISTAPPHPTPPQEEEPENVPF